LPGWLECPCRTAILLSKPWEAILATRSQPRFWRQLAAWLALYALILQTLLVGVTGAQFGGQAMADHAICLHDGGGGGALPDQAPGDDHGATHCLLCLAMAHQAIVPSRAAAPAVAAFAGAAAFWPVAPSLVAGSLWRMAYRTRAPPVMA